MVLLSAGVPNESGMCNEGLRLLSEFPALTSYLQTLVYLFLSFMTLRWTEWCRPLRLSVSFSDLQVSIPVSFRLLYQTSLKCSEDRPTGRCPRTRSPHNRIMIYFDIRPSFNHGTWPSHGNRRWQRRRCIPWVFLVQHSYVRKFVSPCDVDDTL